MTLSPAPFEDPSMSRTSPSEDPQTFMGPFSFFLVLSALVKLLPKSLWLCVSQHSGYSGSCSGWDPVSTCSMAQSASIAQPLYVSEPWGSPPALTNSPARFSFQDGFSRLTSATATCPFIYKILLLLKICLRYRLAAVVCDASFSLLYFLGRSHCHRPWNWQSSS